MHANFDCCDQELGFELSRRRWGRCGRRGDGGVEEEEEEEEEEDEGPPSSHSVNRFNPKPFFHSSGRFCFDFISTF